IFVFDRWNTNVSPRGRWYLLRWKRTPAASSKAHPQSCNPSSDLLRSSIHSPSTSSPSGFAKTSVMIAPLNADGIQLNPIMACLLSSGDSSGCPESIAGTECVIVLAPYTVNVRVIPPAPFESNECDGGLHLSLTYPSGYSPRHLPPSDVPLTTSSDRLRVT